MIGAVKDAYRMGPFGVTCDLIVKMRPYGVVRKSIEVKFCGVNDHFKDLLMRLLSGGFYVMTMRRDWARNIRKLGLGNRMYEGRKTGGPLGAMLRDRKGYVFNRIKQDNFNVLWALRDATKMSRNYHCSVFTVWLDEGMTPVCEELLRFVRRCLKNGKRRKNG
jgi:hypothetical protein